MPDEEIIITTDDEEIITVEEVVRVPIRNFAAFMKGIAADDLWKDAERYLRHRGCTEILVSLEPIRAVKEMNRQKLDNGEHLSKHSRAIPASAHGPGGPPGSTPHPKPPPSPPPGGGGSPPPPPNGGGDPPPPPPAPQ